MHSIKSNKSNSDCVRGEAELSSVEVGEAQGVRSSVDGVIEAKKDTISIRGLADAMGLREVERALPNGRIIKAVEWLPTHLPEVFRFVAAYCQENSLGKNDLVVIDGGCPGWLLATISHACHPVQTAVRYPQGGPEVSLPLGGVQVFESGEGESLRFEVTNHAEKTIVSFELDSPQIDILKTLNTLTAPEVPVGKPVFVTGRGPIAIASSLAEAYAHRVPYVALFQPGVGFVVCVSHDASHPVGIIL